MARTGLVLLGVIGCAAHAAVQLAFSVDDIQGDDWHARGISIALDETGANVFALRLSLDELSLPDGHGDIRGLVLNCPALEVDGATWRCAVGQLVIDDSPIDTQDATWSGSWQRSGRSTLVLNNLAVARGTVTVEIESTQDGEWLADLRPYRVDVMQTAALADAIELPRDWNIKGRVSGSVRATGNALAPSRLDLDLVADRLNYASPDGTQAAEDLVLKADVSARWRANGWRFDARFSWPKGALYADPLFFDAAKTALAATLSGSWQLANKRLSLDGWSLDLGAMGEISGTGQFSGDPLTVDDLTIAARVDDAGMLYGQVMQAFLIGTPLDDLDVTGRFGVVLHYDRQGIEQAGLELNRIAFNDRRGRFALERADGSVAWDRSKSVPVSRLDISAASVYRIPTGAFAISARFAGDRLDLVEPVIVPVLDGTLALDRFALQGALMAGEQPRWQASASVQDVSLAQLTRILEWPPFNGTVSGRLRDMQYADQVFRVGGGLELNAFGGTIAVSDLSISDPLGFVPILRAQAQMRGLDLEALTETFSFGRITGRLNADVSGLELVAWQPSRFDLRLYTPPDDDSRHRISQRAVRDLTELGSGVPAGLSATILGIFEEFRYDRIDLSVRLQGDAAELDGLARPDGGYYLVKGSGLPRIDVIGRNRSVAWKDLVERLRQIRVEGAQIK